MKLNHLTTLLALLFLFYGCSVKRIQKKGDVQPSSFHSKLTFETHKTLIVLKANINGETKNLIFDTGADLSLIQRDSLIGNTSKFSGASKRKMKLGNEIVPLIEIGEAKFLNTYALNGNMVGLKEKIPNFGGLIGQSIISKANWLIDYPNNVIEISNKTLIDTSYTKINISTKDGAPYTSIEMNGKKYKVIIDFGSSSSINLPENSEFATDVIKHVSLTQNTRDRYTLGGLQTVTEKVGIIPTIILGDFVFKDVPVNLNISSQPRIGVSFFRDYHIYIDNSEGEHTF
jgi:hypothetical protein